MRCYINPLAFAACSLLGGCIATPTTFVLSQPQRALRFETYVVRFVPIADDPEFDPDLKATFENGLKAGLAQTPNLRGLGDAEANAHTLELHYRAAGMSGGNVAIRAGCTAVNAFLPVGVVPEFGGGDLGVETTFLDRSGVVVGKVLVQSEVHGLLSTDSRTMSRIGAQTGEYVASRFATGAEGAEPAAGAGARHVINLSPEKAQAELAALEPYIGVWDMTYDIEIAEEKQVRARVVEVGRWEAGGRIFFQFAETQDVPEKLFRCNAILWDPVAHGLQVLAIDSVFGSHESNELSCERKGDVLRSVCTEKERITEIVDVFAADGSSRTGTKEIWSTDHSRLLLRLRSEGRKRPVGPQAAPAQQAAQ